MGYLQASMVDGIFGMLLITISNNIKASFSLFKWDPNHKQMHKTWYWRLLLLFFLINIDFKIIDI